MWNSIDHNNVRQIRLISYNIANTVYTINVNNNKIKFVEGATSVTITLTNQNYTASTLATHIAAIMTVNSPTLDTYTGTYNTNTYKMTFSAGVSNFYFDFNGLNFSTAREMGFSDNHAGLTATSQKSENAVRIDNPYILLETNFQNNIESSSTGTNFSWVLQLPSQGTSETYNINSTYSHITNADVALRSMKIRLKDMKNRTIDFNNSDCCFLFEFIL